VRGINVQGVSRGLVSLLFPSKAAVSRLWMAEKKGEGDGGGTKKPSGKINERAALMNDLGASKTARGREEEKRDGSLEGIVYRN